MQQTAAKKKDTLNGMLSRTEETVSRFIPYTRHIDETTIKTREGYLLKVIKLEGLPFETADQIDLNQRKNIRATLLRGLSNSRFAVYHHVIRREDRSDTAGFFENDWCQNLDKAYRARLASKRMFVNEQYLTIIRRPQQGAIGLMAEIGRTISKKIDRDLGKSRQIEAHKALNEAVANIMTTLSPYRPTLLGLHENENGLFSDPLSFLSYLINLEKVDIRLPHKSIAEYLPQKRISFGKETFEIRGAAPGNVKLGAVLSIKEYAEGTGPGMLDGLLRLPHEFIVTQSFGFVDRQAALSAMRETKRKIIAGEQGATSLEEDMDNAIDDLASGRATFGEHHLTVTAIGQDAEALDRSVSDCVSAFVNLGIVAAREDINMEAAFWAQLPGNFSYIARRSLISNNNFAAFSSLHAFPSGRQTGNHWGGALTKLETTSGTPYWFNFHERDVGNFTIIGPTGTGKTVLMTFLHAQAQRLAPRSVYFDKDRGAEIYLRAIGGDYTVVRAGLPTGLNPLQIPDTPENRAFLREWIRVLVASDNTIPVSAEDIDIIAMAVDANFKEKQEYRRLSCFAELLAGHETKNAHSLAARIAKWHGGGEHAWLFDNLKDVLCLDNKNIGFDLTAILDNKISRTPWMMYVFHRVGQILNGERAILMLDEGWKMLDEPVFAARIKDWMKTIRKQNGIVGFATQSARDALGSSVGDAIIEQSPTQIFLPNARAVEKDYCEGFGLSHRELKLVRELTPESRCFLIRHGTESVIARLDLSSMDDFVAVLSGRAETVRLVQDLIAAHGPANENWMPHFLKARRAL
ncbi:MAG: VirB4 family type IV secretion/conjugal transfer ATPase [Alphaproteobacteria bacterium]|nr:VirB4 family type IV secretion/conjugal transfer ATPase [Alphaproteobacteria bacterium]